MESTTDDMLAWGLDYDQRIHHLRRAEQHFEWRLGVLYAAADRTYRRRHILALVFVGSFAVTFAALAGWPL